MYYNYPFHIDKTKSHADNKEDKTNTTKTQIHADFYARYDIALRPPPLDAPPSGSKTAPHAEGTAPRGSGSAAVNPSAAHATVACTAAAAAETAVTAVAAETAAQPKPPNGPVAVSVGESLRTLRSKVRFYIFLDACKQRGILCDLCPF